MKNNINIVIGIAVVAVALSFFGGMKYQESKSSSSQNNRQFGMGRNGTNTQGQNRGVGGAMGRGAIGDVISVDDTSMTVKMIDGSSKIVLLSEKTTYHKTSDTTKDDVKVGIRVLATGNTNPDGSVTASSVQINPVFSGMEGRNISLSPAK